MSKKRSKCKYMFVISKIDILKVNQKFGLNIACNIPSISSHPPQNTTNVNELSDACLPPREPTKISYFDQSKRLNSCTLTNPEKSSWCWWCRHSFSGIPYSCPLGYNPLVLKKSYRSAISKSHHTLKELRGHNYVPSQISTGMDIECSKPSFTTDGWFCSINCMIAFVNENKTNPTYYNSKDLIAKMFTAFEPESVTLPPAAPHWRLLMRFGGHLTINEFRENMTKVSYCDKGTTRTNVLYNPISRCYEEKLKF